MKRNFLKLLCLSGIALFSTSFLIGCDNGSNVVDANFDKIVINSSTFNGDWVFTQGDIIDYSTVAIDLYDGEQKVETIKASDNSNITYTPIDTSEVAEELTFTVTFTHENKSYKDSHTYSVEEGEGSSELVVLTGWEENPIYTSYKSETANAIGTDLSEITEEEKDNASFIDGSGKFYIANHNAVSLKPTVLAYDVLNDKVITYDELPGSTEVTLKTLAGASLELSSYFDEEAITALETTGMVDFKDDLTGLATDIVLTFTCDEEEAGFADISYNISVVDGWNITEAKQLVLLDNIKTDQSYIDLKNEVLGTTDATSATSFENFVLFNDVTLEKADLPSYLIWTEETSGWNSYIDGSLIDWEFMYEHNVGESYGNADSAGFNLYGNYNKIELGETFPYVLTEKRRGGSGSDNYTKIDTHTTLFGNQQLYSQGRDDYLFTLKDLSVTGNQGVSENGQLTDVNNTPDDTSDDVVAGGILFTKNQRDMIYDNCVINHFFTLNVLNGEAIGNVSADYQTSLTVNNSKLSDCYSTMLFNHGEGDSIVTNSILRDAGGPLFINQAVDFADPDVPDVSESEIEGSNVIIDEKSILDNLVTGQGGWFDIYNASASIALVKGMSDYGFAKEGKSLFKDRGDTVQAMNCIAITMTINNTSAAALTPGIHAVVSIGGKEYTNYTDGEAEFDAALAAVMGNPTDQAAQATLLNTLSTTPWGAQLAFNFAQDGLGQAGAASLPLFTTYDGSGDQAFFTIDDATTPDLLYVSNLLNALMGGTAPTLGLDDDFADGAQYLGSYVSLASSTSTASLTPSSLRGVQRAVDPATMIQGLAQYRQSYLGSTAYGVVFEIFDK